MRLREQFDDLLARWLATKGIATRPEWVEFDDDIDGYGDREVRIYYRTFAGGQGSYLFSGSFSSLFDELDNLSEETP